MNNKNDSESREKQEVFVPTYPTQSQEVTPKEIVKFSLFRHRREQTVHWKDSKELHRVLHDFPNIFRAILLELMDKPLSRTRDLAPWRCNPYRVV